MKKENEIRTTGLSEVSNSSKKKQYDFTELQRVINITSPEDMIESLDNILFAAIMNYMDTAKGAPTEKNSYEVVNVRFLLEALRECCQKE